MFDGETSRLCDDTPSSLVLAAARIGHSAELSLARHIAHWQNGEGWKSDGSRSATAWLTWKLAISYHRAAKLLSLGQALLTEPLIATALDEHQLSVEQAEPIIAVGTPERADEYQRDLAMMLGEAANLSVAQIRIMTKYWADLADQTRQGDTPPPNETSKLHVAETLNGHVEISGTLKGDHGALMLAALEAAKRLGQPDDDDPEANHENDHENDHENARGDDATNGPASKPSPSLTDSEKAAEALAIINRFFLDHHQGIGTRHGERAHVQVTIDLQALTTGTGHATTLQTRVGLTAEQARQIACDCNITRILTIGPSDVIDVGRTQRIVPLALRKALVIRDRHCRAPGCTMPATYCDGHHQTHWVNGGDTNLDNCLLLCRHHHGLVHTGGWTITGNPNNELTFTNPAGTHQTTRPPGYLPTG